MQEVVTSTNASLKSAPRFAGIGARDLGWLGLFIAVGTLIILRPLSALEILGVGIALGACWWAVLGLRRAGLELWQVLSVIALTGYMLLNYGFENLTLHVGGFPIIISYGLMYASLGLAVFYHWPLIRRSFDEPAVVCAMGLLALSFFHLVIDVPSYGMMALRDSSMCLDALFLLLGMLWAMKNNSVEFLTKWLTVVFVLNLFYGATMPWGEKFWSWSPESGVFLKVPILGNFNGIGDLLLAGGLFCICVGAFVVKRPSWLMPTLAVAQFLVFSIAQVRRMYVAAVVVVVILMLLGETKKFAKLLMLLPAGVAVLLLATTLGGFEITGRIGPVNMDFFKDHVRSISNSEGTPGSAVESRFTMADEAFQHFLAHPVVGEGFGLPLLTVIDESNGAVTRMPHNSSLTYLARLGVVGFALWIAFHFCLIKRFVQSLRQRHRVADMRLGATVLWLFLFYVLFMIGSLVEAAFEFPSGAIPFYFLMGLALGLMRWRFSEKTTQQPRADSLVSGAMQS